MIQSHFVLPKLYIVIVKKMKNPLNHYPSLIDEVTITPANASESRRGPITGIHYKCQIDYVNWFYYVCCNLVL